MTSIPLTGFERSAKTEKGTDGYMRSITVLGRHVYLGARVEVWVMDINIGRLYICKYVYQLERPSYYK